jgi:hypothetical protein
MKETVLAGGEGRKRDSVTGFPQFVSLKQEKFALMSNFVESLSCPKNKENGILPVFTRIFSPSTLSLASPENTNS